MEDQLAAAARNEAVLSDRLCRAQGLGTRFLPLIWRATRGTTITCPDAITLPGEAPLGRAVQVLAEIRAVRVSLSGPMSVLDSDRSLDLAPEGFQRASEGQWMQYPSLRAREPANEAHRLTAISNLEDLGNWEWLWRRGKDLPLRQKLFPEPLIARKDFEILAHVGRDGRMTGGAILFSGAGVTSVSHVFTLDPSLEMLLTSLAVAAGRMFPGRPVIHRAQGAGREPAAQAGFRPIGPARIWRHPGGETA